MTKFIRRLVFILMIFPMIGVLIKMPSASLGLVKVLIMMWFFTLVFDLLSDVKIYQTTYNPPPPPPKTKAPVRKEKKLEIIKLHGKKIDKNNKVS